MLLQITLPPVQVLADNGHAILALWVVSIALSILIFEYVRTQRKYRKVVKEKETKDESYVCELNVTLKSMDAKLQKMHEEEALKYINMENQVRINRIHIMAIEKYINKTGFEPIPWIEK